MDKLESTEWRFAVERVLEYIDQHIDEPITLSVLAAFVSYSPYHFARIFKNVTGVSTLYYISSLRIHKSKELLLHTSLTIRDIALDVGYQSLGSFTSSFTNKVGVSPAQFRVASKQSGDYASAIHKVKKSNSQIPYGSRGSVVCGNLSGVNPYNDEIILVGLFRKPVPEGMPIYLHLLRGSGFFRLANIRPSTYYLMATTVSKGLDAGKASSSQFNLFARWEEPFKFDQTMCIREGINLSLRPRRRSDPPILSSFPVLLSKYFQQMAQTATLEK